MIVPEYWGEAKVKDTIAGSQITIKRFGWSDISQADANKNALERATEALSMAKAGEKVRKTDHKLSYNGSEGLPIREEIIQRDGEIILTRNSYGALCLNTPDVLFIDIDLPEDFGAGTFALPFVMSIILSAGIAYVMASYQVFIALFITSIFISKVVSSYITKAKVNKADNAESELSESLEGYVSSNPNSHFRLYKTPMGFRILGMDKTYSPDSEETKHLFDTFNTDPLYAKMCANQKCFRARVSPKPWRINMERLTPRPGVWPIKQERLSARYDWVKRYEKKAIDFASCHFIKSVGSNRTHPNAEKVMRLHDKFCQADSSKPLA